MNTLTTRLISIFLIALFAFPASSLAKACTTSLDCSPDNSVWCNPDTKQCAVTAINTVYVQGYSDSIIGIINVILLPVLMAVAFIVFLYGVFKYFIYNGADSSSHEEGRTFIMYGIIGFVVILSVWGLVGILGSTLGLSPGGNAPAIPTL